VKRCLFIKYDKTKNKKRIYPLIFWGGGGGGGRNSFHGMFQMNYFDGQQVSSDEMDRAIGHMTEKYVRTSYRNSIRL